VLASRYYTPTYSVGVARSSNGVAGPFEKKGDSILHVGNEKSGCSGPGHCSVVSVDDKTWMLYHAHVGYGSPTIDTERELLMDEVVRTADGWMVMKDEPVPSEIKQVISDV